VAKLKICFHSCGQLRNWKKKSSLSHWNVSATGNLTKVFLFQQNEKGKSKHLILYLDKTKKTKKQKRSAMEARLLLYRAWLLLHSLFLLLYPFTYQYVDPSSSIQGFEKERKKETNFKHKSLLLTTVVQRSLHIYINVTTPYLDSSRLIYQRSISSGSPLTTDRSTLNQRGNEIEVISHHLHLKQKIQRKKDFHHSLDPVFFLRLLDRERQREGAIFFMSKMSERKPAKVLTVQMDLTENSSTRPIDRSITHPAKRAPIDKKKHEKMLLTAD
jgi:hypothetical protein